MERGSSRRNTASERGNVDGGASSPPSISVLLVEDNRLLREGIAAILDREPDIYVVAVAEDADDALLRLSEAMPRVVLVDASLGCHDCRELVTRISQSAHPTRVIVMDMLPAPEEVVEFVRRGASGFVVKEASVDAFVETIRMVAEGQDVLPPVLASPLLSHIAHHAADISKAGSIRAVRMTKRERDVIGLIADGMSNQQIARHLHLSIHTVKSHVRNILEKLELHSRLQVAAYAHKAGRPTPESE